MMFLTALIMTVIIAVIMTGGRLLSGSRPRPSPANIFGWAIAGFVVNFFCIYVFLWLVKPAMTGWLGGYLFLALPLFINVLVAWLAALFGSEMFESRTGSSLASAGYGTASLFFLFLILIVGAAYPLYGSGALREIPQVKVSDQKIEEVSVEHIRLVPLETARWFGEKVIGEGNLGAQFRVGEFEIQRIKGKLYWAAPLEFRDFWKWLSARVTPGYVLVNAEEKTQQAELHIGYQLKYLPSAYFASDLKRYLYQHGWNHYIIQEPTFEIDEDMKPWWVVTVGHPTVGLDGQVIDGVVLVDPETGKMEFYNLGEMPEWVDRAIPWHLAIKYNNWWGRYVHGWWNTLFSEKDVQQTTEIEGIRDAFLVFGKDNQAKWFTGFTSPAVSDTSLTGYSMMNSVTGETIFYPVSGFGHEGAVVEAVNASVANFRGWHGAQPIFYNIYGEESWVVPVLSETNIIQKVAIVEAATMEVVLGETKQDVLAAYALWLEEKGSGRPPTQVSNLVEVEGRVVRMAANVEGGRTIFYFTLDAVPDRIFKANSSVSDKLVLTQVGDKVQVMFADTEERTVAVRKFGNLDLMPQVEVVPQKPASVSPTPAPTPTPTPTPIPKKYSE